MKTTKLMVEDLRVICENIEAIASACLYPARSGLWFPGQLTPVIEENQPYFINDPKRSLGVKATPGVLPQIILSANEAQQLGKPVFIDEPKQITGDVYNVKLEIVLLRDMARFLRTKPSINPVIQRMVQDCVQQLVDEMSAWRNHDSYRNRVVSSKISYAKSIGPYLLPQYRADEVVAMIEDQMLGMTKRIMDFIGDDGWIMHFVNVRGSRLSIEKTTDYRIFDWMRTHNLSDEE